MNRNHLWSTLARAALLCAAFATACDNVDSGQDEQSYDPDFPVATVEATLLGSDDPASAWHLDITDDTTGIVVFQRTIPSNATSAKVGIVLNSGRGYTFSASAHGPDGTTLGNGTQHVFIPGDAAKLNVQIVINKPQTGGVSAVVTDVLLNNPASFDSIFVDPPNPLPGMPVTLTAVGEDWDGQPFSIAWTMPLELGGGVVVADAITLIMPDAAGLYEIFCEVKDPYGAGTLASIQLDTVFATFASIKWNEYQKFNLDTDAASEVAIHTSEKPNRVHIHVDSDNDGAENDNDDYRGTFTGTITGTSKNGNTVTIEIDQNGDGLPDKTVTIAPAAGGGGGYTVTES